MKTLFIALALTLSAPAFAATTEIWEGSGTHFNIDGNPEGTYGLKVENTSNGKATQSHVTVTLPDGSIRKHQCSMTYSSDSRWKSECDNGFGGGQCLGDGLCASYIEDSNGKAYAMTIVMDSPTAMRLLRTELKNGHAVRFFREKLQKR